MAADAADAPLAVVRVKRKRGEAPAEALLVEGGACAGADAGPSKRKKVVELASALDAVGISGGGREAGPPAHEAAEAPRPATTRRTFRRVETVPCTAAPANAEAVLAAAQRAAAEASRFGGGKRKAEGEARDEPDAAAAVGPSSQKRGRKLLYKQVRAQRVRLGGPQDTSSGAALYDLEVDRSEAEAAAAAAKAMEENILCNYMPMVREYIDAAGITPRQEDGGGDEGCDDEYVYDVYCVATPPALGGDDAGAGGVPSRGTGDEANGEEDIAIVTLEPLPEERWGEEYSSEYDSDDSNAENHPDNDYPEEEDSDLDDEVFGRVRVEAATHYGARLGGGGHDVGGDDSEYDVDDYDEDAIFGRDNEEYGKFAYAGDDSD